MVYGNCVSDNLYEGEHSVKPSVVPLLS